MNHAYRPWAKRPKILSFRLWRSWLRREDAWRSATHDTPEEEHRAYRAFNRRYLQRQRIARSLRRAGPFLFAAMLALGGYYAAMSVSPWSPVDTLKHVAAFPNCAVARFVGVAPARRGAPGYYERHDADRDGIACEPIALAPGVLRY